MLGTDTLLPWLVLGDVNENMSKGDDFGRNREWKGFGWLLRSVNGLLGKVDAYKKIMCGNSLFGGWQARLGGDFFRVIMLSSHSFFYLSLSGFG
ncbi:hypothetical protein EPI10_021641 [Gossypium australe]|uniref:Uncharacterized protein n=1 Tax=Gossypium australe TaxID=47621 RepID=A0A5B6WIW9_9ROSI|nr:hypothetical protein EPI10_021641 [Gossypium australe]